MEQSVIKNMPDLIALAVAVANLMGIALQYEAPPQVPGLTLENLVEGSGTVAAEGHLVSVHFIATAPDGKEIANTELRGLPWKFILKSGESMTIWDAIVMSMAVGGEREAIVTPDAALGTGRVAELVSQNMPIKIRARLLQVERVRLPLQQSRR